MGRGSTLRLRRNEPYSGLRLRSTPSAPGSDRSMSDPPPHAGSIGYLAQLLCSTSLIMKDAVAFQCGKSVGDVLCLRLTAGYGEEPRRDEIEETAILGKFSGQGMPCVGVIRSQLDSEGEVESVALHSRGNERVLSGSHHAYAVAKVDVVEVRGDSQNSRYAVRFQATAKSLPHLLRVRFRGHRKPYGLSRFLSFWKGMERSVAPVRHDAGTLPVISHELRLPKENRGETAPQGMSSPRRPVKDPSTGSQPPSKALPVVIASTRITPRSLPWPSTPRSDGKLPALPKERLLSPQAADRPRWQLHLGRTEPSQSHQSSGTRIEDRWET